MEQIETESMEGVAKMVGEIKDRPDLTGLKSVERKSMRRTFRYL